MSATKKPTAKEMREAEKQAEEVEREQEVATATAKKELLRPLKKRILCGAVGEATGKPRAAPRST